MTRKADVNDFVSRGEDSEPLTVTEDITLDGDTVTVEFVPATKGFMNELDAMESEAIEDEGIPRVLEHFRSPDFRDETGEVPTDIADNIPLPRLNKLFDAFLIGSGVDEEAVENPEEYAEGNIPMDKSERAKEMRSQS